MGMPMADAGSDALLAHSGVRLAAGVRDGTLSPVALVEHSIRRCQTVQRRCNAVAVALYDQARRAAEVAERQRDQGAPLGRLHGVPFSFKEGLGLADAPKTCGSRRRQHKVAGFTATAAQRLIDAGAIPVALGNQAEMALWPETDNPVYGRTSSPYRNDRSAGGSSGGDAVLVASACVPFALGTDGGGSVRIPAACNGIFGLKPSRGLVPLTGHLPLDERGLGQPNAMAIARHFAAGPLCRHAEDLPVLLEIIAGPDPLDRNILDSYVHRPPPAALQRLYLCQPERLGWGSRISPAVALALDDVAHHYQSQGTHVERWLPHALNDAFAIWLAVLKQETGVRLADILGDGQPVAHLAHAWQALLGQPQHATGPWLATVLDSLGECLGNPGLARQLPKRDALLHALTERLDGNSVLALPALPGTSPEHGHALRYPGDIGYTALFNVLGLPALTVPMGRLDQGCPVAVQLVAGPGQEPVLLDAARSLELAFGGWIAPPF
ncbi:glutamyl-tRNA amidotransferase subunit A [Pseudomonas monteilii]|uniref:Glutamyl-tRNA amidotransferase subunit A n=2 Tax=Pseudomonas TaxID=286 RepID=A0AAE6RE30_9PSED|nr:MULTISPECIES: amidase [Pseudomonas]MCJ7850614.1 amidase [Pseudomonas monteilii]QHB28410.1 glutamyl-tRNA amidotransferase subunit A [Pseudomonas monteilii]SMC58719.1 fatty acid amide hydrolase 2 [Pseudomonas sp. URIL14HWK12:I5]